MILMNDEIISCVIDGDLFGSYDEKSDSFELNSHMVSAIRSKVG